MDSTYGDARVRWHPKNNLLYGFCWEHSSGTNLAFDNMETIDVIADKVKNGLLHIPSKGNICLRVSASGKTFMPGLLWPICSLSNNDEQQSLIQSVVKLSADDNIFNRNKLLNFSIDGDASRRQICASMMEKDVTTFNFGVHLEGILLFDVQVGTFRHTVNYDAKHYVIR